MTRIDLGETVATTSSERGRVVLTVKGGRWEMTPDTARTLSRNLLRYADSADQPAGE